MSVADEGYKKEAFKIWTHHELQCIFSSALVILYSWQILTNIINNISLEFKNTKFITDFCQWLMTGRWFSQSTPVSSTNKTNRQDITEILLKVALNTIKPKPNHKIYQGVMSPEDVKKMKIFLVSMKLKSHFFYKF